MIFKVIDKSGRTFKKVTADYVKTIYNEGEKRHQVIFYNKSGIAMSSIPTKDLGFVKFDPAIVRASFKIGDSVDFETDYFEIIMDGHYYFYFYRNNKIVHKYKASNVIMIDFAVDKSLTQEEANKVLSDFNMYGIEIIYNDGKSELWNHQDISYYNIIYPDFSYTKPNIFISLKNGYEISYSSESYYVFKVYTTKEAWDNRLKEIAKGEDMTEYTKYIYSVGRTNGKSVKERGIEKVIFNPPATIVMWNDGTKTVVKCTEDDTYTPEVGLAMCIAKRYFGSGHKLKKMCEKYYKDKEAEDVIMTRFKTMNANLYQKVDIALANTATNISQQLSEVAEACKNFLNNYKPVNPDNV